MAYLAHRRDLVRVACMMQELNDWWIQSSWTQSLILVFRVTKPESQCVANRLAILRYFGRNQFHSQDLGALVSVKRSCRRSVKLYSSDHLVAVLRYCFLIMGLILTVRDSEVLCYSMCWILFSAIDILDSRWLLLSADLESLCFSRFEDLSGCKWHRFELYLLCVKKGAFAQGRTRGSPICIQMSGLQPRDWSQNSWRGRRKSGLLCLLQESQIFFIQILKLLLMLLE